MDKSHTEAPVHEYTQAQAHLMEHQAPGSPNPTVLKMAKGNTNDILFLPREKHLQNPDRQEWIAFQGLVYSSEAQKI